MSEVQQVAYPSFRVLVKDKESAYYVPISHSQLDTLVGRLMQMCDLTGDQEQRKALKDTIKQNCREWLDQEYEMNGYDRWQGVQKRAKVVEL